MPNGVRIDHADGGEATALSDLARKTYADAYRAGMSPEHLRQHVDTVLSPERWREYLATDKVLVARRRTEMVGYVQFGPTEHDKETEVKRLYVDESWQRRGLGSRLLSLAIEQSEAAGAEIIWIGVWHENADARRLYERFGFVAVAQKAFVLPSGRVDGHDIRMIRRRR